MRRMSSASIDASALGRTMTSPGQTETIRREAKGCQAKELLRNYWQPVSLLEELPDKCAVSAVRQDPDDD